MKLIEKQLDQQIWTATKFDPVEYEKYWILKFQQNHDPLHTHVYSKIGCMDDASGYSYSLSWPAPFDSTIETRYDVVEGMWILTNDKTGEIRFAEDDEKLYELYVSAEVG